MFSMFLGWGYVFPCRGTAVYGAYISVDCFEVDAVVLLHQLGVWAQSKTAGERWTHGVPVVLHWPGSVWYDVFMHICVATPV